MMTKLSVFFLLLASAAQAFIPVARPRAIARIRDVSLAPPLMSGEDWRDGSESGRRFQSKRLKKMAEMEAATEAKGDKSILAIITAGFFGATALGLFLAVSNGFDGSPRV